VNTAAHIDSCGCIGVLCSAWPGGKRCKEEGCTKSAQGDTSYCKAHAEEADAAKRRAVPSLLEATRVPARRMAGAGDASTRAASSPLKAIQATSLMEWNLLYDNQ
jgi:hypothetical protein